MLELQNIGFRADDGKEILKDISIKIDDKFVAVTGPNGSGKSTLLKVIMGIIKPTSGRVIFDGEDITDLPINERADKGMSFAFQQPVRFKGLRVRDVISIAKGDEVNMGKYLRAVGLCPKDYLDREINDTLSGGEMKRIEIATAAARGGKLSLFDEPEAGIDLWSFQNLIQVFEKMRSQINDSSIMIISHQERILEIADEIVVLRAGRIAATGPREDILPTLIGTPSAVEACKVLTSK